MGDNVKRFLGLRDKILEEQYNKLNKEQREAVLASNGPVLILAGAGSGKTTVLVNRITQLLNFGPVYKSMEVPPDLTEADVTLLEKWYSANEGSIHDESYERINKLLKASHIYPSSILAITFTNKAAGEMKERVKKLVGDEAYNMWITTFHSSCVRILRREADKLGYNKNFAIYDSDDQKILIKQCMKELEISDKEITEREIINKISAQKDILVTANQYKNEVISDYKLNKIADVYILYQKKLKSNNAMDFDDLIMKTVELFKNNGDVLEFYQNKFKYIMVDEYQDTNKSQYEFVRLLSVKHKNICVVGDDDQCIYEWRGADISNILGFEKDYPCARVIKLEQNYRSTGNILRAANDVIKNNGQRKSKVLRTDFKDGEKIKLYHAYNDKEEAAFVCDEIKKGIKENKNYSDFAILYRTNAQSRIFEDSFIKASVPYRIIGSLKFYDRKEIRDMLAYLKLINNPLDDLSLVRIINVPKRSIGSTTIEKLKKYAEYMNEPLFNTVSDVENVSGLTARNISCIKNFSGLINGLLKIKDEISVSKMIEEILEETGYMNELILSNTVEDLSRIENLKELVSAAVDFEKTSDDKTLSAFLEKVTLVSDVDNYDQDADSVVLMTVHSAKGLEFPVVFMTGMENGIFPGMQSFDSEHEMEESRRLCYVAITRAKKSLYLTCAKQRSVYGRMMFYEQSEFINEISQDLIENVNFNTVTQFRNESMVIPGAVGALGDAVPYSSKNSSYLSREYAMANKSSFSVRNYQPPTNNNLQSAKKENSTTKVNEKTAYPGRKVKHTKFGTGTIISITKIDGGLKLTVAFDNIGIKNLIADVAPIELL